MGEYDPKALPGPTPMTFEAVGLTVGLLDCPVAQDYITLALKGR